MGSEMGAAASGDGDERYRRLIDQSGLGLFQTDGAGRVHWINDAAAAIVGYQSSEEFLADIEDIRSIYVDPSRREEFQRLMTAEGRVSDFEYEIRRKDGSTRWISVSAVRVVDSGGDEERFEGTVLDVTARKLTEAAASAISSLLDPTEAVERFAEVLAKVVPFEQLTLAVIEGDSYRRLVSLSPGSPSGRLPTGEAVPLRDNSMSEVVEQRKPLVVQDTSRSQWVFDRKLQEVGVRSYAIFPLIEDGDVFATFSIGFPSPDAFTPDVVSLLTKHTGSTAHAVKNILTYEGQKEVVRRLEELAQMKNDFFAAVSHDLRNPLSLVIGVTGILLADWERLSDERKRELLRSVAKSGATLSDLLERDLDVALIQSGELHFDASSFSLGVVVHEAVEGFAASYPERAFDVEVASGLPYVLADPRRQVRILQNLLSNAVKFSPDGSTIRVTVERLGSEITVAVSDMGPGIAEDEKERLFERLTRLEPLKPGAGLGLYITKSFVEAQGGRLWVESESGEGARFVYTVPVAEEEAAE